MFTIFYYFFPTQFGLSYRLKKFTVRPKGGRHTTPPPKYATVQGREETERDRAVA